VTGTTRVDGKPADGQDFFRYASLAEIPNVLGVLDFSCPAFCALTFLTASRFSECCFRQNGVFYLELSRSLVDKWLLVRTPIASDPPNRTSNYPTTGLTADKVRALPSSECGLSRVETDHCAREAR
jgi:hypothetical protein